MPAPTALLKPQAVPETFPLPAADQEDEELIREMGESDFTVPNAEIAPQTSKDTEMAVDEEGRPRFAPGKDVVRRALLEEEAAGGSG